MTTLAQGASVDLTVSADSTLTIQNPGGFAVVESPVGTRVWAGGQADRKIDIKSGVVRVTATTGGLFYELVGDPVNGLPVVQDIQSGVLYSGSSPVSGAGKGSTVAVLGNSISGQAKPVIVNETYTASSWAPGGAVTSGQFINPPTMDLRNGVQFVKWQALNTGVSGAYEPVWPLTVGSTVVDGTVTWQTVATTNNASAWGLSWWTIAQALAGQPLDEIFIVGQSGRQSDTILAKLPEVLAANPDVVYFAKIFENDCWPGVAPNLTTISARFDAYVAAVDSARAAGKKVMVQTVLPNGYIDGSAAFTGYSRGNGSKAWVWLNTKIREMARARRDVILFEPDLLYLDPANTNGAPWPENTVTYLSKAGAGQQLKKTDGVHPLLAGAWIIGNALAAVLRANFPAPARFGFAADETAKSTSPGPLKGGSRAATGSDSNVSGTIAAGANFNINNYTGAGGGAGTASLVARTDMAGNWQRLVYAATSNGDGGQLAASSIPLAPYTVGTVVQAFREVRMLASSLVTFQQFQNILRFTGAGSAYDATSGNFDGVYFNNNTGQDLGQFITADTVFVWKTAPVAIPAGTTAFEVYDKANFRSVGAAASGTIDWGRESIQRWRSTGALT